MWERYGAPANAAEIITVQYVYILLLSQRILVQKSYGNTGFRVLLLAASQHVSRR